MESITTSLVDVGQSGNLQPGIDRAAKILLAGGVVAYPTETFYGLGVDVRNDKAIQRLFSVKKRPATQPVLILIPSEKCLDRYANNIPPISHRLMEIFWPGGLTLVFEAGPMVSALLTGGTDKIGIRLSSHPIATLLSKAIEAPISGTSANISTGPPCRNAGEVLRSFGKSIDLILDGGVTSGKVGSTVLDVTVHPPRILREGMVSRRQLEAHSFVIT